MVMTVPRNQQKVHKTSRNFLPKKCVLDCMYIKITSILSFPPSSLEEFPSYLRCHLPGWMVHVPGSLPTLRAGFLAAAMCTREHDTLGTLLPALVTLFFFFFLD